MFLLLTYWIIAGVTAEDVREVYYQLKSSSVCLHVKSPPPHKRPEWKSSKAFVASPDDINPGFANKVDYFREDNTLCFKNLTDADSGVYEFSFHNENYTSIREVHKIVVQELVPRPVIVMSVLDANMSAGICNISVNCSVHSDWLWAFCDADYCRTSQMSLSVFNITILTDNRTIVCRGNNSVSTEKMFKSLPATCHSQSNEPEPEAATQLLLIVIVLAVGLCLLLVFIIFVVQKLSAMKHDQTSTAHLIQNQQVDAQTQPETRVSTSSSIAYENVAALRPRQTSSTREQGSMSGQQVDTVYSILQPTKANSPQGTSDNSKPPKKPQETHQAPAPQADTQRQAEQPEQIDTVYSMLQKPRRPTPQHQ